MRYIFVSHFSPNACGHGGEHRTYQIAHELARIADKRLVGFYGVRIHRPPRPLPRRNIFHKIQSRLNRLLGKSAGFQSIDSVINHNSRHLGLLRPVDCGIRDRIGATVSASDEMVTILLEHPGFVSILPPLPLDRSRIVCLPQNLETLDAIDPDARCPSQLLSESEFSDELDALAKMEHRLLISKVEAGLLNTIGLPSQVYPYRPVGEVREFAMRLRSVRAPEIGQFVLLGSATHHTTREGMEWLVRHLLVDPIPGNIRIDVVGSGTDRLLSDLAPGHPNIQALGFVTDEKLNEILRRTNGVLAPQFRGMGSLTKLSELSMAGIPCFTGEHAMYAMDVPPGVRGLPMRWETWREYLSANEIGLPIPFSDYEQWDSRQPTLCELLGASVSAPTLA